MRWLRRTKENIASAAKKMAEKARTAAKIVSDTTIAVITHPITWKIALITGGSLFITGCLLLFFPETIAAGIAGLAGLGIISGVRATRLVAPIISVGRSMLEFGMVATAVGATATVIHPNARNEGVAEERARMLPIITRNTNEIESANAGFRNETENINQAIANAMSRNPQHTDNPIAANEEILQRQSERLNTSVLGDGLFSMRGRQRSINEEARSNSDSNSDSDSDSDSISDSSFVSVATNKSGDTDLNAELNTGLHRRSTRWGTLGAS